MQGTFSFLQLAMGGNPVHPVELYQLYQLEIDEGNIGTSSRSRLIIEGGSHPDDVRVHVDYIGKYAE